MIDELCEALPFLKLIPLDLRRNIDTSTLYEPKGAIAEMRAELENILQCYVMTYRTVPLESSGEKKLLLCRLLVPACLDPDQLKKLKQNELTCHDEGIVLVAYKKPLQLRENDSNE